MNKAYKDLGDEEIKREADATIQYAREELRRERRKITKKDNAYQAAAALRTATAAAESQQKQQATGKDAADKCQGEEGGKDGDGGARVLAAKRQAAYNCYLSKTWDWKTDPIRYAYPKVPADFKIEDFQFG